MGMGGILCRSKHREFPCGIIDDIKEKYMIKKILLIIMGLLIAGGVSASMWYTQKNPITTIRETVSDTELAQTDPIAVPTPKTEKRKLEQDAVVAATVAEQPAPPTPPAPFTFTVIADAENYSTPSGHNDVLESMLAKSASYTPAIGFFSGDVLAFTDATNTTMLTNLKTLIERYFTRYYIVYGKHDLECGTRCFDAWQKVFFTEDADKKKDTSDAPAVPQSPAIHSQPTPQPDTTTDQAIAALQIPTTEIPGAVVRPVAPPIAEPPKPYHSFDHEQTHFILLSSDYPMKHGIDDAQMAWLAQDLAATTARNIIVFSHVPPINFFKKSAKECHDMTCDEPRRQKLIALFEKHGVDLVISGHEHAFDHQIVNGIHYVLAGNTGNSKRYKNTTWKDSFLVVTVEERRIIVQSLFADGTENRTIDIPTTL